MTLRKAANIETMYREVPFAERFRAARADGFEYVEFWGWTDKDLGAVEELARAAGIGICGFNGDADFSLIDPAHRKPYVDFLRQSCEAAKKVGARSLTIHSNALGEGGRVVNAYAETSSALKLCSMYDTLLRCLPLAESYDLSFNLEALNITTDHVGNFLADTRTGAELCRLIASPRLKILYDCYHMQINEGNLCDTMARHVDQIGHVHVADVPGRHEPGTGEINYSFVLRRLEAMGYAGIVGYELFPQTTTAEAVKAIMAL